MDNTETKKNQQKRRSFSYIDNYGNKISISSNKGKNLRFTLYHSNIKEGYERKEFEYMSILLSERTLTPYLDELYERVGNVFVGSVDPIRDGGNSLILEKDQTANDFVLTFCRDLSNDLNLPYETNVALDDKPFYEFFDEITGSSEKENEGIQYQMKLTH